jgi:hypothetical protein
MKDGADPEAPDMITMGHGRRRLPRPAALAGVAIVALAGGAGAGYAATHSFGTKASDTAALGPASAAAPAASPSPTPSVPAWRGVPGGKGGFGRGFGGFGGFLGGPGAVPGGIVHGQAVVPKSGGGYETVDIQRGQVTAVSSTSITVKSSDGFTATYAVTGSTVVDAKSAGIGSVKTGDTVGIIARVSGSTATAATIIDPTAIGAGRASFGFPTPPANPPATPPS